jgi:hypothetical protein
MLADFRGCVSVFAGAAYSRLLIKLSPADQYFRVSREIFPCAEFPAWMGKRGISVARFTDMIQAFFSTRNIELNLMQFHVTLFR